MAQASTALAQELQIELGDLKDELNRMRNTQTKVGVGVLYRFAF